MGFPSVIDQIKVFVYFQQIPMDLVFDNPDDLKNIDAAIIISCLHEKTYCPEGVHYKDEVTGIVYPSNPDVPKVSTPYVGAPPQYVNVNPDGTIRDGSVPEAISNKVSLSDGISYVIFGIIIISLIGVMFWFYKIKRKPKVI